MQYEKCLYKLNFTEINNSLSCLLETFLTNKYQTVVLNG